MNKIGAFQFGWLGLCPLTGGGSMPLQVHHHLTMSALQYTFFQIKKIGELEIGRLQQTH